MNAITLIVPYYRNPHMLARQIEEWMQYPKGLKIVVVDDCSPEPASRLCYPDGVQVYRIRDDIKWNRNGARNLGAHVAETPWIMQIDIDHMLPAQCVQPLLDAKLTGGFMYRFPRFRRGAADETRMKDKLPRNVIYGPIKPHGDSYLCTRDAYWCVGGYDEDYSGHLGGGSPFLATPAVLRPQVYLEVFTRSECVDASDNTLSRDTKPYANMRRHKERYDDIKAHDPLRFEWERVI